jgi:hypothetical protein
VKTTPPEWTVRQERWEDGTIVVLRENDAGDRWYQKICDKNENYFF